MQTLPETARPRQRKPRPKPARSVRLCVRPDALHAGVICLTVGKLSQDYILTALRSDFGRGFRLHKVGHPEEYDVNLNGRESTCDCPGHTTHGHCKHVAGLQALCDAGRI